MPGGGLGIDGLGLFGLGADDSGVADELLGVAVAHGSAAGALAIVSVTLTGETTGHGAAAGDVTLDETGVMTLSGVAAAHGSAAGALVFASMTLSGVSAAHGHVSNGSYIGLVVDGQEGILGFVYDADGTQHDISEFTCEESFELGGKSNGGPDSARWNMPFPGYVIPDDYARVSFFDAASGLEFWRGRFLWELPDWDGCSSLLTAKAEGAVNELTDESFGAAGASEDQGAVQSVFYGPQIRKIVAVPASTLPTPPLLPSLIGTVIALTPEDAIVHAVTQRCPSIFIFPGDVATTGAELRERKDFLLQTALSVINYMTGLFEYLATPYIWNVRPKLGVAAFSWQPMPSTPRYRVRLADGAVLGITRDPRAIANRVVVQYGGYQTRTSPDPSTPISYDEIPITRDIVLNLQGQVNDHQNAQQVADGIRAKAGALRLGWSYSIAIPRVCPIYDDDNGGVVIAPWMIEEGNVILIEDLNPSDSKWGNHTPPEEHFITEWKWSGKGEISLSCGEVRKQTDVAAIRSVIDQGERLSPNPDNPRFPMRKEDAAVIPVNRVGMGPGAGDSNPGPFQGQGQTPPNPGLKTGPIVGTIGPGGDPPYDTPQDGGAEITQFLPQQIPQHPPVATFNFTAEDVAVGGIMMAAVIASNPVTIMGWEILSNVPVTFEVSFLLGSTGEEVLHVRMDAGSVIAAPWGGYTTQRMEISPKVELREMHDQLVPVITVTDENEDLTGVMISIDTQPLFPNWADVTGDGRGNAHIVNWDGMGRSV